MRVISRTYIIFLSGIIISILLIFSLATKSYSKNDLLISPVPLPSSETVKEEMKIEDLTLPIPTTIASNNPINILLLGLDGRKGDGNPRCDAIHMLSFNPLLSKLTITSIPRGTEVDIPGVDTQNSYISNACHDMGIDYAAGKIEKITKIHPDYIVTVGFSQALGIFRFAGLPPTATLNYLRNRNLPFGDYQRSHNQEIFIKDMIIKHLKTLTTLPKPLKYLIYKTVNTNLPFDKAMEVLDEVGKSGFSQNPERIILAVRPVNFLYLADTHVNENNLKKENDLSLSEGEFLSYQEDLGNYIEDLNQKAEDLILVKNSNLAYNLINVPFKQQLWLQIENPDKRQFYHFLLLKNFVQSSPDKSALSSIILDFMTEMDLNGQTGYKEKGEELLKTLGI